MSQDLKGEHSVTLQKDKTESFTSDSPLASCNVTLSEGRGTVTFTLLKNGNSSTRGPINLSRDSGQQSGDGDSQVITVVVEGKGAGDNKFRLDATV